MIEVGKRYTLKTREQINKTYDKGMQGIPWGTNEYMMDMLGQVVTISNMRDMYEQVKGCLGQKVWIKEDDGQWAWHSDLFLQNDRTELVHNEIKRLLT